VTWATISLVREAEREAMPMPPFLALVVAITPSWATLGASKPCELGPMRRVRVPSMTVEEISLVPPPRDAGTTDGQRIPMDIPGVSDLHLLSTQPSPDGYEFQQSYDYYNGNIMRELFGSRSSGGGPIAAIVKDGRAVPVRNLGGSPYNAYNAHFVGWVAKD